MMHYDVQVLVSARLAPPPACSTLRSSSPFGLGGGSSTSSGSSSVTYIPSSSGSSVSAQVMAGTRQPALHSEMHDIGTVQLGCGIVLNPWLDNDEFTCLHLTYLTCRVLMAAAEAMRRPCSRQQAQLWHAPAARMSWPHC
jgi:hypothetical protein